MKTSSRKIVDSLGLFSSVIMCGLLLFLIWRSANYFLDVMMILPSEDSKWYALAVFITVITVMGQWIDSRIKYIVAFFNNKKEVSYGRTEGREKEN